ncbi:MAG: hypothetical protein LAN62_01285 [Acidobacteriia bacterium]|nr:hypothetical protein [Terriglobia bacterium]
MEKEIFLATALMLSLGPFPADGLCQGSAEYSIGSSHAASATVKAGSALDKATRQLSGRLQQKLAKPTEQSRQASRQPSRVAGYRPVPAKTPTMESAGGIEVICSPSDAQTADKKAKAGAQSEPCISSPGGDSPSRKANLPSKPETQEKYPSVVNLSFSK